MALWEEKRVKFIACLGLVWVFLLAGCGSSGPELGTPGAYGGPCLEDGSCNTGLKCVDHVCKED